MLCQWLDLSWVLPTGVRVRIDEYAEWVVYNEIFVSGEYDRALDMALDRHAGGPVHIVDLGAHVGFFTLRAIDHLRRRGVADDAVRITAVEARASACRELETRLLQENRLRGTVTVVRGVVGHRRGVAVLAEVAAHPPSSSARRAEDGAAGRGVAYVDLSSLLADAPQIDLLKCDIEGSEEAFIENYPDVLRKTRVAVFEFHRHLCDVGRCQALLRESGFVNAATLRDSMSDLTYVVWR